MSEQIKDKSKEVSYAESGLDERILRAVGELGFENMTPIQAQAIPVFMEGKDLIGQARTGTGKTAAFGIPILQMVDPEDKSLQALVLCPTRELAIQAAEEIRKFGKFMEGIKVLPIYGGQDIVKQIRSLKGGVQIVIGTPGRVMDHMRRHTLKLQDLKIMVLDEADEMLNMGFREDIETILEQIPGEHQTGLFSATMPKAILNITKKYQKADAVHITVSTGDLTVPQVRQYYYEVKEKNKDEVTSRLLDYYNPTRALIFCNTKMRVAELAETLKGRGYFAEGFHGDMTQAERDRIMNGFRKGFVEILIATDVAARGIDVTDVEAVINYDVPQDIEYYVHRIGRTGRAGKSGRSFTLVVGREIYKIRDIEHVCKTKLKPRHVPSAADINTAKADNVMKNVKENMSDINRGLLRYIERTLEEEDFTAMELAAALLKMQLGEEVSEMELDHSWFDSDEYKAIRRARKHPHDGSRRDGGRRDGGRKDGGRRDGGRRDGGRRDGGRRDDGRRDGGRRDSRRDGESRDRRRDGRRDGERSDRRRDDRRGEGKKPSFSSRKRNESKKRDAYGNHIS